MLPRWTATSAATIKVSGLKHVPTISGMQHWRPHFMFPAWVAFVYFLVWLRSFEKREIIIISITLRLNQKEARKYSDFEADIRKLDFLQTYSQMFFHSVFSGINIKAMVFDIAFCNTIFSFVNKILCLAAISMSKMYIRLRTFGPVTHFWPGLACDFSINPR